MDRFCTSWHGHRRWRNRSYRLANETCHQRCLRRQKQRNPSSHQYRRYSDFCD